jgi:hypothetical protein
MKKILIATNVLLLLIIIGLLYFCFYKTPVAPAIGTASCPDKFCRDFSTVSYSGLLESRFADTIAYYYHKDLNKSKITKDGLASDEDDARSVWFSFTTIKKFLYEVEKVNCEQHCDDSLGLRIYFGKYPDVSSDAFWHETGMESKKTEYANHHTLFMVPTYFRGGIHYDFNPFGGECRYPLRIANTKQKFSQDILFGEQQNHGSLIPPEPAEGSIFN